MKQIDLNSDLGEGFGPWPMGDDATMLSVVTSANIACGGHASDPETMFNTLVAAKANGVTVGAHPGYNDREGFGRRVIPMEPEQIGRMVTAQIGALHAMARLAGTEVSYIKPHGALANLAARDDAVATAIVKAAQTAFPDLALLAISGTRVEVQAKAAGVRVFSEIFADRGYLSSGQLVPRGQPGAMIEDADEAADRLLEMLETGLMPVIDGDPIPLEAHSICVHGDSPHAVGMAQAIRSKLDAQGIKITGFLPAP
ncbi:LamB/YcsF family protein [Gymnodinialimonas hymeniacidonis]|uniref:LamB/YcsF family protein n=1 Tax=Gymnodinialimonas hymeniacidonis TaxID=3126508 RepID=UPI0034C61164